jgi:hypothetical protein
MKKEVGEDEICFEEEESWQNLRLRSEVFVHGRISWGNHRLPKVSLGARHAVPLYALQAL